MAVDRVGNSGASQPSDGREAVPPRDARGRRRDPASLLALLSGIALVQKQGGGDGRFWVDFGLAVWVLSFLAGALYIGPTSQKLAGVVPEHGLEDPSTARRLSTLLRVARFDAAMRVLVVVDAAAQPTF